MSRIVIVPVYYLSILTYPIIKILTFISQFIARIFGIKITNENLIITEEDIRSIINFYIRTKKLKKEKSKIKIYIISCIWFSISG